MTEQAGITAAEKEHASADLIGRVRRFGSKGVPYVVLAVEGDEALIRVITTGEETMYSIADVSNDPED